MWRLDNSRWLFMFTSDGGFRYDETGRLSAHPRAYGTYAVDGDTISVDIDGRLGRVCREDHRPARQWCLRTGPIHVLPVGSDPSSCGAPFAAQWVLEPVLPVGYFDSATGTVPASTGTRRPATTPCWATGTTRQGGYLVELRDDGTYSTITGTTSWPTAAPGPSTRRSPGSPWSAGRTRRRVARGTGSSSTTCGRRTSAVLGLQGDLGRNDCDVAWQGAGWFSLACP